MCGICGMAYRDSGRSPDRAVLLRMRDAISHRGPDGVGIYLDGPVGLGHRRLSIIDLETGDQPLANEDETVWVTYNGEIYNFRELRGRLEARGHRFRTRSDTEVLVHAYEEYGDALVSHLNGMFAFALWDGSRRRLLLARDHLGIKPLFYAETRDGLFFASEVKGVLAGTAIAARPDSESIREYLLFRSVAGGRSFFEGVRRLPPGHLAVWAEGRLTERRYWFPPPPSVGPGPRLVEAADRLGQLLEQSVCSQLMSDVPLGTFCSGGIDSGLVTGYAAAHAADRLNTYTVSFDDPAWDETALAAETARRFGAEPHVLPARPEQILEAWPSLLWYHDEPLSHPNSIAIFLLSRYARQAVKVVLTGEGSDELFGGYPRYQIARLSGILDRLPAPARSLVERLSGRVPTHRARRLAELVRYEGMDAVIFNATALPPALVEGLAGSPPVGCLDERRALAEAARVPGDMVATLTRYEALTYLPCLLDRMDRMTMAASLEARVPFLDLPLAEWAGALPSRLKVKGTDSKRLVRRHAEKLLSSAIVRRRKSGFGLPLGEWLRERSAQGIVARLQDRGHPATGWLDGREVGRLVDAHRRGADQAEALWLVANFYLWCETWLEGRQARAA